MLREMRQKRLVQERRRGGFCPLNALLLFVAAPASAQRPAPARLPLPSRPVPPPRPVPPGQPVTRTVPSSGAATVDACRADCAEPV
jgi:hypothetical protein